MNPDRGEPEIFRRDQRVEAAVGVPLVFSTNSVSATYVATILPGGVNGDLFRVQVGSDRRVSIQSPHTELAVNGEPRKAGFLYRLDAHEAIQVRLGPRGFDIVGVFQKVGADQTVRQVFEAPPLPL